MMQTDLMPGREVFEQVILAQWEEHVLRWMAREFGSICERDLNRMREGFIQSEAFGEAVAANMDEYEARATGRIH